MKKRLLLYGLIILCSMFLFNWYAISRRGIVTIASWHEHGYPAVHRAVSMVTDLKFRLLGEKKSKEKIVIAAIDTSSLDVLGRWPWRRDILVSLLESLVQLQVKAVGFDILLSEDHSPLPEQLKEILLHRKEGYLVDAFDFDRELGKAVATYPDKIVLEWHTESPCQIYLGNCPRVPVRGGEENFKKLALPVKGQIDPNYLPLTTAWQVLTPIEGLLANAKYVGFANNEKDSDSVTRSIPLLMQVEGRIYPSFALSLAASLTKTLPEVELGSEGRQIAALRLQNKLIPVNRAGVLELRHLGAAQSIPHVSVVDILRLAQERQQGRVLASDASELLKGAVVLVGATARGLGDLHATPYGVDIPGVEIQATALENILSGRAMTLSLSTVAILNLLLLGCGLLLVFTGEKWEARLFLSVVFFLLVATFLWDYVYLFRRDENAPSAFLYFEVMLLSATCLVVKYIDEESKRKFIRAAFSKYVSPVVVDSLIQDHSQLSLGGKRETLTVLFSDIRGFTTFSETVEAKVLSEFLNDFHGLVTEIIFQYGGTLDKYIGDAVMAFWGAPLLQPDHASRALSAAVKIVESVKNKEKDFQTKYGFAPRIGVGVHCGEMTVGNMGSERSFGYTVVGDSVNLASRLEGATKFFGVPILTTAETLQSVERSSGPVPSYRKLGRIKAKGKRTDVEVVEILTRDYCVEFLAQFESSRQLFVDRKFTEAKKGFSLALQIFAEDVPTQRYIELCDEHATMDLPTDWNGSWALTEK